MNKAPALHLVLFEPEIPPNTGNIIRLAANTGCTLHLIKPLGFELDTKKLRRAGLDYHEWSKIIIHDHIEELFKKLHNNRIFACTTKTNKNYCQVDFQPGDVLLFGPETRGLPEELFQHPRINELIRIPMQPQSRSLNLSNSVAVIAYEALRQLGFQGLN